MDKIQFIYFFLHDFEEMVPYMTGLHTWVISTITMALLWGENVKK